MTYEGQIAETVTLVGHGGDRIAAYFARPLAATRVPGVVVFHHAPGWDEWTKEVVRKLAHHGYAAICPHLFDRFGPGAFDDVAAAARAAGGIADEQAMGDGRAAMEYLRGLPYANGKVGTAPGTASSRPTAPATGRRRRSTGRRRSGTSSRGTWSRPPPR